MEQRGHIAFSAPTTNKKKASTPQKDDNEYLDLPSEPSLSSDGDDDVDEGSSSEREMIRARALLGKLL
jgi:hypothetical protein